MFLFKGNGKRLRNKVKQTSKHQNIRKQKTIIGLPFWAISRELPLLAKCKQVAMMNYFLFSFVFCVHLNF